MLHVVPIEVLGVAGSAIKLNVELRNRRRELHLTQGEVGRRIGCSQVAVSLFEAGQLRALSEEKVKAFCRALNLDPWDLLLSDAVAEVETVLKCCTTPGCPSGCAFHILDELRFKPRILPGLRGKLERCEICGEELAESCPNNDCGAPLSESAACCPQCGWEYMPLPDAKRHGPAAAEVHAQNREDRERIEAMSAVKALKGCKGTAVNREISRPGTS